MKIMLSGYNVDSDGLTDKSLTPETISAAYARISRSEKEIPILRNEARVDVEKSRKSNETIVFGLGHASIAEHSVFNFDLMQISRAAIEHIQSHRLASYTEKSQRYVSFDTGYHLPVEIEGDGKAIKAYKSFCGRCFDEYSNAKNYLSKMNLSKTETNEDARYFLPLSTNTQCGLTINGRELEYLISDLRSQDSCELKDIGDALLKQVEGIAPSIIKYTDKRNFLKKSYSSVKHKFPADAVEMLVFSNNQEAELINTLNFSRNGEKLKHSARLAENSYERIASLLLSVNEYDRIPREFEMPDVKFVVYCSASCFAQLKRHRMSTIIPQAYSLKEKPYIPESFLNTPLEEKLNAIAELSMKTDKIIRRQNGGILQYTALNASKRAVLVKMNSRELYHFVRLRSDRHAQLEIRKLSDLIASRAKTKYPLLYGYLCGKDEFKKIKDNSNQSI
ncbi:MAG: FAD-dependent thymidylate synthase [bacterium]